MTIPLSTTKCVLVAEDDDEFRRLLVEGLRGQECRVIEAKDGYELWKQLTASETHPAPDAIVSDMRMPGMNGLDVLELLQRTGAIPPFILFTAFGDAALHERARELGAAAVFDKPFEIDELCAMVRSLLTASTT